MLLFSPHCNIPSILRLSGRRRGRCVNPVYLKIAQCYFSNVDSFSKDGYLQFNIPKRLRQKVVGLQDAVSLVANGDTVSCSGFVSQGAKLLNRERHGFLSNDAISSLYLYSSLMTFFTK
jgi:hypothetical protein